jgi:hypothetical protein
MVNEVKCNYNLKKNEIEKICKNCNKTFIIPKYKHTIKYCEDCRKNDKVRILYRKLERLKRHEFRSLLNLDLCKIAFSGSFGGYGLLVTSNLYYNSTSINQISNLNTKNKTIKFLEDLKDRIDKDIDKIKLNWVVKE